MQDEFLDEQPVTITPYTGTRPFQEVWTQYILEFPLPTIEEVETTKATIIQMLAPIINTAARSNIKRPDVRLHLRAYDIIWNKFYVYKRKGKYNPDLLVLQEALREGFELMLDRSIEMWQMRMVFEPKQSISQRIMSEAEKRVGLFKRKKPPEGERE